MKEPKVAGEVLKKRVTKKTLPVSVPVGRSVAKKTTSATSKKKTVRNFTLAQLSATPHKTAVKHPVATLLSVPEAVTEVQSLHSNTFVSYAFITTIQVIGMGLALFGVCFAFVFGSGILPPHSQNAQVLEPLIATTTEPISSAANLPTLHCAIGFIVSHDVCVNPKPTAKFSVPGNHEQLQGPVPVKVEVSAATRVKLSVYSKDTHTLIPLGIMTRVSDGTFQFTWPTKAFQDGNYFLQAVIDNAYGTYETGDTSQQLTVLNIAPTSEAGTSSDAVLPLETSTNSNIESVTSIASSPKAIPAPTITTDTATSTATFSFTINSPETSEVKLYARLVPDGTIRPLGYAYHDSESIWRYQWLASSIPAGKYLVGVNALHTDKTTATTSIVVNKIATSAAGTTTPISTGTTSPVAERVALVSDPVATTTIFPISPTQGSTQFKTNVPGANTVALYAQNTNNSAKTFLGKSTKVNNDTWILTFNTTLIPDGDYVLIAAITNNYGTYENRSARFAVKNRITPILTQDQTEKVSELKNVLKSISPDDGTNAPLITERSQGTVPSSVKLATGTIDTISTAADEAITAELDKLAVALRSGDTIRANGIRANIESLSKQAIYRTTGTSGSGELNDRITSHVNDVIKRTEHNVITIDKLIAERTGNVASKDSDNDGIPDFDEVTIYQTNPFVSDTDNDGFLDGAEIMSGYDPLSPKAQTLVAYESPKVAGIEQHDLLSVTSITTAIPLPTDTTASTTQGAENPVAVISGKAPANSYVTLYIFSTPIVITIKTDSDGGWNYHFDHELENGSHEVYVGVTDNAGKIVAKSAPFSFIKTAEAYSGQKEITDAVAAPVAPVEHNLLSSTMLYILFGLSILVIGLVLVLIGSQLDIRRHRIIASEEAVS